MKKIILVTMILLLGTVVFGQSKYRRGIIVGASASSTLSQIDSIAVLASGQIVFYNGADSLTIYTPVADQIDGSTLYTAKHPTSSVKTDNYTLVLTDDNTFIDMTKASTDTVFVPLNASVAFPLNTTITISSIGAGDTYVSPISGATLNGAADAIQISAQWNWIVIRKYSTDGWLVAGGI